MWCVIQREERKYSDDLTYLCVDGEAAAGIALGHVALLAASVRLPCALVLLVRAAAPILMVALLSRDALQCAIGLDFDPEGVSERLRT